MSEEKRTAQAIDDLKIRTDEEFVDDVITGSN